MAAIFELLGVLLFSFGWNLIPFAGPSNLFIALDAALLVSADPFTLGFLVALGAASAKSLHYIVTVFVGKHLREKWKARLDKDAAKIKRWAILLIFAAAATPIPDEPVVIPLGLMRYNPAKFFAAFFLGKLSITVIGAYLGPWSRDFFAPWLSPEVFVVISIVLTVVVTVILLKVDLGKVFARLLGRQVSPSVEPEPTTTPPNNA
ncbi:MAG: VTT domain-containing protein [Candidatus Bathyarchaeia archaeon]